MSIRPTVYNHQTKSGYSATIPSIKLATVTAPKQIHQCWKFH